MRRGRQHGRVAVVDLHDREAAVVLAFGVEAEDAVGADEARGVGEDASP